MKLIGGGGGGAMKWIGGGYKIDRAGGYEIEWGAPMKVMGGGL